MAPLCGPLLASSLGDAAKEAIKKVKGGANACIKNLLPGVMDWTKAITIGMEVEVSFGATSQVIEFGVAYRFDGGLDIKESKCYVGASAAVSLTDLPAPDLSFAASGGVNIVAWRGARITRPRDLKFVAQLVLWPVCVLHIFAWSLHRLALQQMCHVCDVGRQGRRLRLGQHPRLFGHC